MKKKILRSKQGSLNSEINRGVPEKTLWILSKGGREWQGLKIQPEVLRTPSDIL